MWQTISRIILRNRVFFLVIWALVTAFMTYQTTQVKLSFDLQKTVPSSAPEYIEYEKFKSIFGDEGNLVLIALKSDKFWQYDFFSDWVAMTEKIEEVANVTNVLSPSSAVNLVKNSMAQRFDIAGIFEPMPQNQAELDSLRFKFEKLPFYEYRLYHPDSSIYLMLVSIDRDILSNIRRITVVDDILAITSAFEEKHNLEMHYSGLPYIRHFQLTTISAEIELFLILAVFVTIAVLFVLFRSWIAVVFPLLIIGSGVVISMGIMSLMGFKVTLLTGLIPSLLIVIGIPNSVYMLNKYHIEFKKHGNKIKALTVIIERIGYATFFTNLTTAVGFGVFAFTDVDMLKEFGFITFISICATYLISLFGLPVIFSFLPSPKKSHIQHLDNRFFSFIVDKLIIWTMHNRAPIFIVSLLIVMGSIVGLFRLKAEGFFLQDVSEKAKVRKDLMFYEKNFNGIIPFEIMITKKPVYAKVNDTIISAKTPLSEDDTLVTYDTIIFSRTELTGGKITSFSSLEKIKRLQDTLAAYSIFSQSLSIIDAMKFARQAYYNGNPRFYDLPDQSNLTSNDARAGNYLENTEQRSLSENRFVDQSGMITRVTLQMADIGSDSMPKVLAELQPKIDSIFGVDAYDVSLTGTGLVSLAGYNYLIRSLIGSVILALLIIALIMGLQFRSGKVLILTLLPNLIPLIFTAAIMGYFRIELKPSTVLIFSVAFGIAVDFSIHFMAKYRQELVRHSFKVKETVIVSLRETGVSMMYTFAILFFGFIIFAFSEFEGTKNLGVLTSITLTVALLTNLLLLPSIIMYFDKNLEATHKKKHMKGKSTYADLINTSTQETK
ncbi:MAG: efflux RND transporter permease subunit [Chitinophagales bacterium]